MPSNYRPTFLLDVIGKLYASMVVGKLNKTITARLTEIQHGFRKGYSTEQEILAFQTVINQSLHRRHLVDLVFVDITRTFDSVPHEALLKLIQQLGTFRDQYDKFTKNAKGSYRARHYTSRVNVESAKVQ